MQCRDGRFHVPQTNVTKVLDLYHNSPDSGGHDGFWKTYRKLTKRFAWKNMKKDVAAFVRTSHACQLQKAKFRLRGNRMTIPVYSDKPLETVHLDFDELRKKGEGIRKTQAFWWPLTKVQGW